MSTKWKNLTMSSSYSFSVRYEANLQKKRLNEGTGVYCKVLSSEQLRIRKLIGRNIKTARIENKFSLQQVAEATGYSKSKISEIENGKKEAGAILLYQLADLFLVSPAYFYTGVDPEIGEDAFFNFSKICQDVWKQQSAKYAQACYEILMLSSKSEKVVENLLICASDLVEKSHRLVQINHDGSWQEMKTGNIFIKSLNKFTESLDFAKRVYKENLSAKKKYGSYPQLEMKYD